MTYCILHNIYYLQPWYVAPLSPAARSSSDASAAQRARQDARLQEMSRLQVRNHPASPNSYYTAIISRVLVCFGV